MIEPGRKQLGPDNATLWVRTRKGGAASAAGHNLLIEVSAWTATLDVGAEMSQTTVELEVDPRSLKVLEGSGGMSTLDEKDRAGISQTIDEEVLKGAAIEFRSTAVRAGPPSEQLTVTGELELAGQRHPIEFALAAGPDGRLTAKATLKQSGWGIKPYSALFGTLKVLDEVTVEFDARLPPE